MKKDYVVRNVYRSFVTTGILTALVTTLGMLIDNVVVGWCLGAGALGAMSIISPVSLVLSAVSNICTGGGTARAAQAMGKGQPARVNSIFTVTLLFAAGVGCLMTAAGLAMTPQIARLLGAKDALYAPAAEYLRGYFLGAVPVIMTSALMGFVKIDGSTRLPLACIAVMSTVNIALDLFFTLVLDMGMFGMALATSVSYLCAVLTGCTHFLRPYASLRLVRPSGALRELAVMAKTGAPAALSRVCDTVRITALNNLLVAAAGVSAVAALNVRTQAHQLLLALVMGTSQAIIPVAGMFFGEEDRNALRATLREALRLGLTLCCAAAAVLLLFSGSFAVLLGVSDAQILAMSASALRLLALTMPLMLVNTVMLSFYQSTGNTGFASMICILQSLVYTLGFAVLLVRPLGVTGVWLAFLLGEACTLMTSLGRIALRQRAFPRRLEQIMCLPERFGSNAENRLEIQVGYDMAQVSAAARSVYEFCGRHGVARAVTDRLSLIVEETAGNVVRHNAAKTREATLDVLVLNKEDALMLRIRDNGARFDPVVWLRDIAPQDREHNGLRLTAGLSDQISYRYSIGLNNLTVVICKARGTASR